jgi:hypothetical protein
MSDSQREPNMRDAPLPSVAAISPDQTATQRQLRYLQAVAREAGLDPEALDQRSAQEFGVPHQQLSRRDASTLIDVIQAEQPRRM